MNSRKMPKRKTKIEMEITGKKNVTHIKGKNMDRNRGRALGRQTERLGW
jgi:hypothetical protein